MYHPFDIRIIFKSGASTIITISNYPSFKSFVEHVNSEAIKNDNYIVSGMDYSYRANDVSSYELYAKSKDERVAILEIMAKQELVLEREREPQVEGEDVAPEPLSSVDSTLSVMEESQEDKIKKYNVLQGYSKIKNKNIEFLSKHAPRKGTLVVFQDPSTKHYDFSILQVKYDAEDKPDLSTKRHHRALEKKYGYLPFIIKTMETEDHYLTKRFLKDIFKNKYIHKYLQYNLSEEDIEAIKNETFLEEYKEFCKKNYINHICIDCSHEITHKNTYGRHRYYCKKCKSHLCGPCQEKHNC